MKFNVKQFLEVLKIVGPYVLRAMPGARAAKISRLVPLIVSAIGEAEQIAGASGADKKKHVMALVEAAVSAAKAAGPAKLDSAEVQRVVGLGIDAVVGTINVIAGAKTVKTQ